MNAIFRDAGIALTATLLSACATVSAPEYPRAHPANPAAPAAAAPAASSALDAYRPAAGRQAPPASTPEAEEGQDHAHH